MNPLVSIIIPTYNRGHLIAETLNSVLIQDYRNWECIVVDDGSTDNTNKLVEEYCNKDVRFQYHHRPASKPKGANACRNFGFEVSKGEYIQLLDSDDLLRVNCLSERIACVSMDATIDLLIRNTALLVVSQKQYESINIDPVIRNRENYLRMFLRYDIPWHTSSALYKRYLFEECKFDESLQRFQDVSFNIKILSVNEYLNIYRDAKIDTFYRITEARYATQEHLRIIIKSLEIFNKIHTNLLRNVWYKTDLKIFNINFYNEYFLNRIKENRKEVWILVFSYLTGNMFSLREKFYLLLCYVLNSSGIIHRRGIGMHRFHKAYHKIFKFE